MTRGGQTRNQRLAVLHTLFKPRLTDVRSPTPSNQPRRTSRTTTTSTSLNTTAVDLHVDEHDVRSKHASRGLNPHDVPGGPTTGNQVVP